MPQIETLTIKNFRNLSNINLKTSPTFNILYGNNGAGKTNFLESIYYLAHGKSFRTSLQDHLIQYSQDCFSIVGDIRDQTHSYVVGIEKSAANERSIRLEGGKCYSISAVTKRLPILLMSPVSYRFFHEGPKTRRHFMDWLVFHVKPSFYELWVRFQQTLKQRNGALKIKQVSQISIWDFELASCAETLTNLREQITNELTPILNEILLQLLPNYHFTLQFSPGWPKQQSLQALLKKNLSRDLQLGYTFYGPQRADLQLWVHERVNAQEILSQGQQKLASYALHLAQGLLLTQYLETSPIYLIDDLPAELDQHKKLAILEILKQIKAQVFITAIDTHDLAEAVNLPSAQLFHVKQGEICEYRGQATG